MDVIHTAIWVSDLERSYDFYVEGLGLEESHRFDLGGVENIYVGGDHGEIQLRYDESSGGVDPDRETLDHVALGVDDVDATFDRVRAETGCPVVEEPFTVDQAGARVAFVEDPDGYVIEFVEQL
ncbi:VOC family protein [Salinirarus marinus]|uniref:VOC family protein n=1 Tax=Salinirarus marinus TaxID=3068310 RepID=UPI003C6C6FBF